jgi:hypothetical protein
VRRRRKNRTAKSIGKKKCWFFPADTVMSSPAIPELAGIVFTKIYKTRGNQESPDFPFFARILQVRQAKQFIGHGCLEKIATQMLLRGNCRTWTDVNEILRITHFTISLHCCELLVFCSSELRLGHVDALEKELENMVSRVSCPTPAF